MSVRAAVCSLASALFLILATFAEAKDQVIDWRFGMERGDTQFDILQCQSVTFDWSSGDGKAAHDVWEFNSEAAYDACDFSQATKLTDATATGKHVISGSKTLAVTKRWFGCRVGFHCSAGNMKVAVKTRPLLADKFFESECVGGTPLLAKKEDDIVACRKRCKRRRDCNGLEYNTDEDKNCKLFAVAPERRPGNTNPNAQCEIAVTTCSAAGSPVPAPPTAATGTTVPCDIEMRVRCKLVRGTTVTNIDCGDIPMVGSCKVKVRYLYFVHTLKPGSTSLQRLSRTRAGAAVPEKNLLISKDGTSSQGKIVSDWLLNTWEEEEVDICKTATYDTKLRLITKKASTGQVCKESQSYQFSTDASNAPATGADAPKCDVSLDLECIACISLSGCGGTDCNFYKDAKPCTRPIRYKYSFSNNNDSFITVLKVGRERTGESEFLFGGQNYIMPKGSVQTYGEDLDFNFCNDGVKDTVFEAVILCNGVEKTITADYRLIY